MSLAQNQTIHNSRARYLWVKNEEILEQWRELTPEKQQKVLQFVQTLKSKSETTAPIN
ncbi:Transposase [Microcystis aeruginosa]